MPVGENNGGGLRKVETRWETEVQSYNRMWGSCEGLSFVIKWIQLTGEEGIGCVSVCSEMPVLSSDW